ncbi:PAS domain S-box protein [Zoogloea sp.]|uniref:PAS domain S-box protein n=1 Tax=Zoogloea sp. TaxID=49181 RepID=UPI0035ADA849
MAHWGLVVALLTTAFALAYLSWANYHDALKKAEATAGGIARVNAFALDTTLTTADMLLAETASILAPRMENPGALRSTWRDEAQRLRHYLARVPQVSSIRVFDAAGELILSTDEMPRQINVADRRHFQQAREHPGNGLILSEVVVSRTTDRNAVILLRAIVDPQGRFLGVVSTPLDLSYFERLLSDAQLGSDGAAAIRRLDGTLVTRQPYVAGSINRSEPNHPVQQHIGRGESSGTLVNAGQFDGIVRIASYQRLEHFPLYVVVGISRADILHAWLWRAAAATLVALSLLAVLTAYRRMARSNRLLQDVMDAASGVSIIATDGSGKITLFNRGAENLLGHTAAEVIGKARLDDFHLQRELDLRRRELAIGETGGHFRALTVVPDQAGAEQRDWTYRRKDGSLVQVAQIITPITAGGPRSAGYLCVAHDIESHKRAIGLQAVQNRALELIANSTPLPRILDQLVRGLEAESAGLRCAILLFDAASGTLRPGAAPNLPESFHRAVDGLFIGADRNAAANAAFLHDAVLVDDIQRDPRWTPLHAAAQDAGLHACWSSPILDAGGHLLGTFAIFSPQPAIDTRAAERLVDVATHTAAIGIASIRAAAALEASEKRMRLAIHAADMDAYEYVAATDRVHRSGDITAAWGLPSEGTGQHYFALIHPDDTAGFFAALRGISPAAPDYAIEYRLRHARGHYIWVADWASAVFDEHGKVDRVFGVCRDISELKALETELHQHQQNLERLVAERTAQLSSSEANIRLILESTADGVYGVDTHGRVTFINPAACRMLGLDAESVIGQHIHALVHHRHADGRPYPVADCPTNLTLRRGETVTITDEVYWHRDGHAVPVIYSTHPMIRDGHIVGAVVSFMDVTERRALEEAREQARLAAERLAQVKSEFLANMSHEIRTPLNGILGFARIGYRDSREPATRDVLSHILDSGKLLLGVVNDILDFSKIEAGKLHLEAVAIDLPALLRATAASFDERAQSKGLRLTVHITPSLPASCTTDPLRLGQILTNLLSNAVKFTEHGEVTLHAERQDDTLLLRVSDTGIGIAEAQLEQLFRAFEQADTSTTRRFGGTGLGLAITRRIVDLFGGRIDAHSQPGQGSRFEVRIPYIPGTLLPMHLPALKVATATERLAGLHVLAAEDNEVNQMVLEDMLVSEGARLVMVENGRAAVERIAADGPDAYQIVLMDIQMPEMDGYEATRRIHQLDPDLPVVGQTAHALAEEKAKCADAGMVAHVAKPLDLDTLVEAVLRHARAPRHGHVAPPTPEAGPPPQIDRAALAARYANRPEFIAKLLGVFATASARTLERLQDAIASGEPAQLAPVAHAIKGSAGNVMAAALAEQARLTEHAARDARPEAFALAAELRTRLEATLAEITRAP